ncbi:hypothetical protein Tco_0119405, partial [Tanacetum coccineum]
TCQTEINLLKSKNKIGGKEREIPNHDLGNVEHVFSDVLERLKVLESRENATSKKKLVEVEMKLELARMEHDMVERRLHASYGWNKRFYMEMVRIGAVSKPPSDDEVELVFWSCIALDGDMIMLPKAMSKARMREIIRDQVITSMNEFMANMNCGASGAGADGAGADGAGADGAGADGARIGGAGP